MSPDRYLLIAFVAAATVAYIAARPNGIKQFMVSDVANKTMCPIKIEIDDDPERIPRWIKYLKCADWPNRLCYEHNIPHGCCKHDHHTYRTECVEIYDYARVSYKEPNEQKTIKVPVGCTCLIEETAEATDGRRENTAPPGLASPR